MVASLSTWKSSTVPTVSLLAFRTLAPISALADLSPLVSKSPVDTVRSVGAAGAGVVIGAVGCD